MQIRRIEPGEIRTIAKIAKDEIYSDLTAEEVEEWFKSSGNHPHLQHFVVEEDGGITGFVSWSLYDRYGREIILEIVWIAVKKIYQRKGIGTQLVKESFKMIKTYWLSKGVRIAAITVETDAENKKAQRFYEKVLRPFKKAMVPKVWSDEEGIIIYFAKPLRFFKES